MRTCDSSLQVTEAIMTYDELNSSTSKTASNSTEKAAYDEELLRVIKAWQNLSAPIRAGIVAMVDAAGASIRNGS